MGDNVKSGSSVLGWIVGIAALMGSIATIRNGCKSDPKPPPVPTELTRSNLLGAWHGYMGDDPQELNFYFYTRSAEINDAPEELAGYYSNPCDRKQVTFGNINLNALDLTFTLDARIPAVLLDQDHPTGLNGTGITTVPMGKIDVKYDGTSLKGTILYPGGHDNSPWLKVPVSLTKGTSTCITASHP